MRLLHPSRYGRKAVVVAGLATILLPFGSRGVFALDSGKVITQYSHDVWGVEDGLPQSSVQAILQTRDGYLWLGTREGLTRFDGVRFTVFDKRNTPAIKNNVVNALSESRDGSLWVATEGGLNRFKGGEFTSYTTAEGLSNNFIHAICEGADGSLWVGTSGGGLNRFKDGEFTVYSTATGLSDDVVFAIYQGRGGSLWVGTGSGLDHLEDGRVTSYTSESGLDDNSVRSIYEDRNGVLWVGTERGLHSFRDGRFTRHIIDGLTNIPVLAIYEDTSGNLWVATFESLSRFSQGRFTSFTTKDGLSSDGVRALCEDREGSLWVGTNNGLNRFRDATFTAYTTKNGLATDTVWSISETSAGDIWIGTVSGLNRFREGKFTVYTMRDGLPGDNVYSILADREGGLWLATFNGLARFRNGRFAVYTTEQGLVANHIRTFCEGRNGDLWIGTDGGLSRFKDGKFISYTRRDGLSHNRIRALYEDREGTLWIGTWSGLNRFRERVGTSDRIENVLPGIDIRSIYEDAAGTLWIGTGGGGLVRLKGGTTTRYTMQDGLFDDVVMAILEDDRGNFWMSCNKGVFSTSRQTLDDFAAGRIASISCAVYGIADGMKSSECNGINQPSAYKTGDGRLWFPTMKGVVVVDPRDIKTLNLPPPVVIEEVTVDGVALDRGGQLTGLEVAPGKERFEFRYTASSFVAPEKVRFRYKLEGLDKDWIDAGARRAAYYNNLPPGDYRLRVIASNSDGVWNEEGAGLGFTLQPRFHQTPWFYALCAACLALTGWGLYRLRVRQVEQRYAVMMAERNRLAREMHDTLIQGIAGASALLETASMVLPKSPDKAKNYLDQTRHQLRQSLGEARQALWNLRHQTQHQESFATRLRGAAARLTEGAPVELQFEVHDTPRPLPQAVEDNLLRICQESVANAVAHAEAQHLRVELHFEPKGVRLLVEDDGRGFDVSQSAMAGGGTSANDHHFGLLGIRERAKEVGGECLVRSTPGEGTEVSVTVPVD